MLNDIMFVQRLQRLIIFIRRTDTLFDNRFLILYRLIDVDVPMILGPLRIICRIKN